MIANYHSLRGTDPRSCRRERLVTDEQPCVGYMHAGMTELNDWSDETMTAETQSRFMKYCVLKIFLSVLVYEEHDYITVSCIHVYSSNCIHTDVSHCNENIASCSEF